MDDGFMIITEDGLDEIFLPFSQQVEHNLPSGCNISVGCYGLLLVAQEQTNNNIITVALEKLDTIPDDTLFNFLAVHYPPDDISLEGILKLAKTIIIIAVTTQGKPAKDIPVKTMEVLDKAINYNLGTNKSTITMESECPTSHQNNSLTTSSSSTISFWPEN